MNRFEREAVGTNLDTFIGGPVSLLSDNAIYSRRFHPITRLRNAGCDTRARAYVDAASRQPLRALAHFTFNRHIADRNSI